VLVALPFFAERRFTFCDVGLVALRVDKRIRFAIFHLFVFGLQAEVRAVRSEEYVARQALEDRKVLT
jgi:hypothetical protein